MLLERGTSPVCSSVKGDALLHLAFTMDGADVELVTLLLRNGADVDGRNDKAQTMLHRACADGDASLIDSVLRHNASVNVVDSEGRTPLLLACDAGDESVVKMLLSAGADTTAQDKYGDGYELYARDCGAHQGTS
jgi:ankyrin repeat protein